MIQSQDRDQKQARAGVLFGLSAYLWWGFAVVYFKAVSHVPPQEVLCHRIMWSLLLLTVLMSFRKHWPEARKAFSSMKTTLTLLTTAILIGGNWLVFIYAIAKDHVVEASLGYYINPLVNVLLGFLFLKERLRPSQRVSVFLAFIGVAFLTISYGQFPWIALFLAVTFAFYGLLRKTAHVESMAGLTVETALLMPAAIGYLIYSSISGDLIFLNHHLSMDLLLMFSGIVTALPLLWFAHAARRVSLATVGFLQYISPSIQLLLGIIIYREPFTTKHLVTFALIWIALAIYSADAFDFQRKRRKKS
ncbi:MAG: EamA family transporter RarD [Planctomycetota bacterium]